MPRRLAFVLIGLLAGLAVGAALGWAGHLSPPRPESRVPAPWLAPQIPDGTALRMAMVHDVLHERFVRHGRAWYEERNRQSEETLQRLEEAGQAGTTEHLDALDDLAVGLERLGRSSDAAEVMRRKLELQAEVEESWWQSPPDPPKSGVAQRPLGDAEQALYRTYANLGTFLMHDAYPKALAGEDSARRSMYEGLEYIRKAIAVNPGAHFGRETWQVVAASFILAALDRPQLLLEYDMAGNRLHNDPIPDGRPYREGWVEWWRQQPSSSQGAAALRDWSDEGRDLRSEVRSRWITRVGAESGWSDAVPGAHAEPVPFDEPVLGILGMWTLGGGANPHFALALGGILERVGEAELAWKAYERAVQMLDRFWPRQEIRDGLFAHCRTRQRHLMQRLAQERGESHRALRDEVTAELERGTEFQKKLAQFEAKRIAEGLSLDNPDFYVPFYEEHGSVASPVTDRDYIVLAGDTERRLTDALPAALLYGGVGSMVGLLLAPRRRAPRRVRASGEPKHAKP